MKLENGKEFKLNLVEKNKWLEALRSGEYLQTAGYLKKKKDDGKNYYCCLGVAREIGLCKKTHAAEELVNKTFLPSEVQDKLVRMNDDQGKYFKQIAAWIEKNL